MAGDHALGQRDKVESRGGDAAGGAEGTERRVALERCRRLLRERRSEAAKRLGGTQKLWAVGGGAGGGGRADEALSVRRHAGTIAAASVMAAPDRSVRTRDAALPPTGNAAAPVELSSAK